MKLAVIAHGMNATPSGRGMLARETLRASLDIRPGLDIRLYASGDPGWPDVSFRPSGGGLIRTLWRFGNGMGAQLRRHPPDVIWSATHLLPAGLPRGVPIVLTLLDVVWRDHPETMRRRLPGVAKYAESCLHRADRIVCISEFTRQRLAHYWPQLAGRARVIHLAPSAAAIAAPARPASTHPTRPTVVNVGTIEPRKNLGMLLAAMAQLPDALLIQCGARGWNVEALIARASRMPNVRLMGYAPDATVRDLYREASVAVFPSIYEGFHLPPLDALALGCPVIATDIPVHREVLGDAAMYVAAGDVPALVAAIRRVIQDSDVRGRLVAAGRERARRYSWDASARRLLALFEEAIAERGG